MQKGNDYTILQFESPTETDKAFHLIKGLGYRVIKDYTIETNLCMLSGNTEYECSAAQDMNFIDLSSSTLGENNSVMVAVLDSGVSEEALGSRVIKGYNAVNSDGDTDDSIGHGTQVASIICDCTTDDVSILPVKVTDDDGEVSILSVDLGIMYAAQYADVINMSLAYEDAEAYLQNFWNTSIDYAIEKGVPVITSAGNSGRSTKYNYPACYEPCWTIGAVTESHLRASFSSYENIDFVALGKNVKCRTNDGSIKSVSGTSYSAPAVAAFAAQMKVADKHMSVQEMYDEIKNMAEDMGTEGFDKYYGYGMPVAGHKLSSPEFTWSEDCADCSISYQCINHPEYKEYHEAEVTSQIKMEPSCTEYGETLYIASYLTDSAEMTLKDIPCNGHIFSNYTSDKNATFDADGTETSICERTGCGCRNTRIQADSRLLDSKCPDVSVVLGNNRWQNADNQDKHELYFSDTQKIYLTATDVEKMPSGSSIDRGAELTYTISSVKLSDTELASADWITAKQNDAISLKPSGRYFVYARSVDKSGNMSLVASPPIVVDNTKPVIRGLENNAKYNGQVTFTVDDMFLYSVTDNGEIINEHSGKYTLLADNRIHNVIATDRCGNETKIAVIVKTITSVFTPKPELPEETNKPDTTNRPNSTFRPESATRPNSTNPLEVSFHTDVNVQTNESIALKSTASSKATMQPEQAAQSTVSNKIKNVTKKRIKVNLLKINLRKHQFSGIVSVKNAAIKVRFGKGHYKRVSVKGRRFTIKSLKIKKDVRISLIVTKKKYRALSKSYKI